MLRIYEGVRCELMGVRPSGRTLRSVHGRVLWLSLGLLSLSVCGALQVSSVPLYLSELRRESPGKNFAILLRRAVSAFPVCQPLYQSHPEALSLSGCVCTYTGVYKRSVWRHTEVLRYKPLFRSGAPFSRGKDALDPCTVFVFCCYCPIFVSVVDRLLSLFRPWEERCAERFFLLL